MKRTWIDLSGKTSPGASSDWSADLKLDSEGKPTLFIRLSIPGCWIQEKAEELWSVEPLPGGAEPGESEEGNLEWRQLIEIPAGLKPGAFRVREQWCFCGEQGTEDSDRTCFRGFASPELVRFQDKLGWLLRVSPVRLRRDASGGRNGAWVLTLLEVEVKMVPTVKRQEARELSSSLTDMTWLKTSLSNENRNSGRPHDELEMGAFLCETTPAAGGYTGITQPLTPLRETGARIVEYRAPVLQIWECSLNGESYLHVDGGERTGGGNAFPGAPDIPRDGFLVELPTDVSQLGEIEILEEETIDVQGVAHPAMEPLLRSNHHPEYRKNPDIYSSESWPPDVVEGGEVIQMASRSWAVLRLPLMTAFPKEGRSVIRTRVRLKVSYEKMKPHLMAQGRRKGVEPLPNWIKNISDRLVSAGTVESQSPLQISDVQTKNKVRLLIMTSQWIADSTAVHTLMDWKRGQYGDDVHCTVVEDLPDYTGHARDAVQAYIRAVGEANALECVLLLGDYSQIPPFWVPYVDGNSYGPIPSDHPYADFSSDGYPDVPICRVPFTDPERILQAVEAAMRHEGAALGGWGERALLIASAAGQDQTSIDRIQARLEGVGVDISRLGEWNDQTDVIELLEQGACFVDYSGHGGGPNWCTTEYDVGDLEQTDCEWAPPGIISISCWNNCVDDRLSECLGPGFIARGKAAWFLGGTRPTWYGSGEEFNQYILHWLLQGVPASEAMTLGKIDLLRNNGSSIAVDDVYNYQLFGIGDQVLPFLSKSPSGYSGTTAAFCGMGNEEGWQSWTENAADWFKGAGNDVTHLEYCPRERFRYYTSQPTTELYYHLCHGGASGFMTGDEAMVYVEDIGQWLKDREGMTFAFLGSCMAMSEVGPGTMSGAFIKSGLSIKNRCVVGYISDGTGVEGENRGCAWFRESLDWQHLAFYLIFTVGESILKAFKTADLHFPAMRYHWGFYGDVEMRLSSNLQGEQRMKDNDNRILNLGSSSESNVLHKLHQDQLDENILAKIIGLSCGHLRPPHRIEQKGGGMRYIFSHCIDDIPIRGQSVVLEYGAKGEHVAEANTVRSVELKMPEWRMDREAVRHKARLRVELDLSTKGEIIVGSPEREIVPKPSEVTYATDSPFRKVNPGGWMAIWVVPVKVSTPESGAGVVKRELWIDPDTGECIHQEFPP